jgi:hypothetical protein
MSDRARLLTRRPHVVQEFRWNGNAFYIGFGRDEHGVVREIFADAKQWGSDRTAELHDSCILLSLLAQRGMTFAQIAASLGENRAEGAEHGSPASIVGGLARLGSEEDANTESNVVEIK